MAIRYRDSYAKMGVEARKKLVDRVAQLGKEAIVYALKKGFRSKPRHVGTMSYKNWLTKQGKNPNLAWDDITYNLLDSIGSVEAWSDWRIHNIPTFTLTQSQIDEGNLDYPYRMNYSDTDKDYNKENAQAAMDQWLGGSDNRWARVWWDVADNN